MERPHPRHHPLTPVAEDRPAHRPRAGRSPLPSGGDIVFMTVLYLLLVQRPTFVFSDASTGWHLVTGQYILDHLRVPHRDLISYTHADKAWVPYEWLFDVVAALLVRAGGLPLLAVVTASAIAFLFALLYRDARRRGLQFHIALAITLTGALASSIHWLARPHLVTFFGVYIFAGCLEALHRNQMSALGAGGALAVTMAAWSNAHPAFIIGFAMVLIYLAAEAVAAMTLPPGEARAGARARTAALAGILVTVLAASLLNASGVSLYPYIAALLRAAPLRSSITEWMSPVFGGQLYGVCLELLFAAIVIGLAASRRRLWLGQLLLLLAFAHLALSAARNVPLFVIVAIPVAADLLAQADIRTLIGAGGRSPDRIAAAAAYWRRLAATFDAMERLCTMHLVPIATVVVLASSCVAATHVRGAPALVSSGFDPRDVPTTTLTYVTRAGLRWDRGLALDNWGGYIRYETGQRVFVDDRLDFYGSAFIQRYRQTLGAGPGWNTLLDEYGIAWVLVPRSTPLAGALEQTTGWRLAAADAAADLFVRSPAR